ncbi:MAG TPA: glycosyltransferase family 39 protein [Candidatus Omnitrophota bacterium]|nr:glycosyltransferase family 39 protein [Candidatus Omnitrophota bacterium]
MLKISRVGICVAVLLLALTAQSLYSAWSVGQTTDETFFSSGGYPIVRYNNYEFLGEHPPLILQLAALPLLAIQPDFPIHDPLYVPNTDRLDLSRNGARFLYQMGNNPQQILFLQRLPMIGLTVLLGLALFFFAGELFGQWAALLSLTLFCFSPNILAHGTLFTTDMGLTVFYFLSIYALKRFFDAPSERKLILLGLACGAAFMSKISSLILLPVISTLFLIFYFSQPKSVSVPPISSQSEKWIVGISLFLIAHAIGEKQAMVLFGPFCVFAFYFYARDFELIKNSRNRRLIFRGAVLAGAFLCLIYSWKLKKKYGASFAAVTLFGNLAVLVIAGLFSRLANKDSRIKLLKCYLAIWILAALVIVLGYTDFIYKCHRFIGFGNYMKPLGIVLSHSEGGHGACLEGSFITCDWRYFPAVMAIKTPLLTLTLMGIGFLMLFFLKRSLWIKSLILVPILFFLGAAMTSKIRIGLRHILPIYPFLFVLGGIPAAWLANIKNPSFKKILKGVLVVLLILFMARTLMSAPDYLAYFNEKVGGAEKGATLVADSNLNWGQDNKHLAEFVRDRKISPIKIAAEAHNADIYDFYKIPWAVVTAKDFLAPAPGFYALGIGIYSMQQKNPQSWFYNKKPLYKVGKTFYIFEVRE